MVVRYLGDREWSCLDADTKPANAAVGDLLTVQDTKRLYIKMGPLSADWMDIEHNPMMPAIENLNLPKYFVYNYNEGEEYRLYDHNFMMMDSGPDLVVDVLQPMIDMIPGGGSAEFTFDGDDFEATTPILIPAAVQNAPKIVRMKGYPTATRSSGTLLHAAASFPDNRFIIETSGGGPGTNLQPVLHVDGLSFYNLNFKDKSATAGKINVGGIQFECDDVGRRTCVVENCWFQYMWRGLELRGSVWWGRFVNLQFHDANTQFVGEVDIRLTDGTHANPTNPSPKANHFSHITSKHDGKMNNSLLIRAGGYNRFYHYHVSGEEYANSVWGLRHLDTLTIHNNRLWDLETLDIDTIPTPDARQGILSFEGTTGVNDNHVYGLMTTPFPYSIFMSGAGVVNNYVQVVGEAGTLATSVNDVAGLGGGNTVEVIGASKATASVLPITTVNSLVRIIDKRKGAERSHASTVADGGTVAHGLMTTPAWVIAMGSIASQIVTCTAKDATNLTFAIKTDAGAPGTSQTVYWRAGVYLS